jgi:hypothetical protein
MKHSSWTSEKIAIAELRSCGSGAKFLLQSCGIAIADSKKSYACPPQLICKKNVRKERSNVFWVGKTLRFKLP